MADFNDLSERELEILRLVATGASNKEIAQQLYISPNTVKVHLKNIFGKIGVASRTEAAMYVVQHGLVEKDQSPLEQLTIAEMPAAALDVEAAPFPDVPSREVEPLRRPARWPALASWGAALALLVFGLAVILILRGRIAPAPVSASPPAPTIAPRWRSQPALQTPRFGLAVAADEEALYAIGGESAEGVTGTVERYEIASGQWSKRTVKPLPVVDVAAAVIGGRIYVPGGRMPDGRVTDRLDIYDPSTDQWVQGASLPVPVSAYALAAFEGKLYLFGGWDGRQYLDTVYEYQPDQDAWFQRTAMLTRRGFAGAAVAGRTIYVIGGLTGKKALAVNEAYMPDRESGSESPWEPRASLPAGRYAMGLTSVADTVTMLGGAGERLEEFTALVYIPQSDEWQASEPPPGKVGSGLGLITSGAYLYSIGGKVGEAPSGNLYVYRAIYTLSFPVIEK